MWAGAEGLAAVKRQAAAATGSCGREDTAVPRGIGGTHPSRISCVCNVETPMGSRIDQGPGKPTVRKAALPSGTGRSNKPMPAAERQREIGRARPAPPLALPYNRPDTGPSARARKGADVDRVSL